mgnify:CR=1 FL=1
MVIIRRNPDGSIANPDMVRQQTQSQNEQLQQQPVSHPALATKRGMQHYKTLVEQYHLYIVRSP